MKNTFKEYHQYTEKEFNKLWEDCLFVFDTNTLLNMYRYSRETVDIYLKVLERLKKNKQLWIPYQVGYEFYENRIGVISDYEKSYDDILSLLENVKNNIETKYKDHPFLDLKEINSKVKEGLSDAEKEIKNAKKNHPKWLEKDDVLESINKLFKGSVGKSYDKLKIDKIKKEGIERYDKKIPPGFKDNKKDDDKKFGDLIVWYQIIDKAKKEKKPIVFISGDIKEDWWLEKDGKRLMPLPQLKKEMHDKANVDFHIYTADRFLKLSETQDDKIDEKTIKEVRKIRELAERRMTIIRSRMSDKHNEFEHKESHFYHIKFEKYLMDYIHLFEGLEGLLIEIGGLKLSLEYRMMMDSVLNEIRSLRNKIMHKEVNRICFNALYEESKYISSSLKKIIYSKDISPRLSARIREYIDKLDYFNHKIRLH